MIRTISLFISISLTMAAIPNLTDKWCSDVHEIEEVIRGVDKTTVENDYHLCMDVPNVSYRED